MLFKLLSLPVVGPIRAVEHVAKEAMRQQNDPAKIMAEFEELRRQRAEGEIDEETYKAHSSALNERFLRAREFASE